MEKFIVNEGKVQLNGHIRIGGAKNAALPIMAASILCAGTSVIHDVPNLSDIMSVSYTHLNCLGKLLWQQRWLILQKTIWGGERIYGFRFLTKRFIQGHYIISVSYTHLIAGYIEYAFRPSGFEQYEYFRPVALYQAVWQVVVFSGVCIFNSWQSKKKQFYTGVCFMLGISGAAMGRFVLGFLYISAHPGSVSYTHLDVYKRQVQTVEL